MGQIKNIKLHIVTDIKMQSTEMISHVVLLASFLSVSSTHNLQILNELNFDSVALNKSKNVLVAFFTSQCAECSEVLPGYEKVAETFRNEQDCVVAQVNGEKEKALAQRYDVKKFPTFKFFSKRIKLGRKYHGGTSEEKLIAFLNKQCGTSRVSGGGLAEHVGRLKDLDAIAKEFMRDDAERKNVLEAAKRVPSDDSREKTMVDLYVQIMERILSKGDGYVELEIERLEKMLSSSQHKHMSLHQRDRLFLRKNILSAFRSDAALKEEL